MSVAVDLIPELADLPRAQRWRVLGGCHLRSFADWRTWAGLLLAVAMAITGQIAVRFALPEFTTRHAPLYGFSGAVVFWLIGSHVSWKIRVSVVRKLVRRQFPHSCPDCGYDLRATQGCCPECGRPANARTTYTPPASRRLTSGGRHLETLTDSVRQSRGGDSIRAVVGQP